MTEHRLNQEPDDRGYGDGLQPWECSCGEKFDPGEIEAAFQHGRTTVLRAFADKPQVYVSQNTGYVVDVMTLRGNPETVDVIFIDWSEITPNMGGFDEIQLEGLQWAAEASLRLPKETAIGNLNDMVDFLEMHFDASSGYVERDAFSARAIQTIKDLKSHITDLEMNA